MEGSIREALITAEKILCDLESETEEEEEELCIAKEGIYAAMQVLEYYDQLIAIIREHVGQETVAECEEKWLAFKKAQIREMLGI